MYVKKFLKKLAKIQTNKAFTWFNSYEPKMPECLKSDIEE